MVTDPISDMLVRIKNAQMVKSESVAVPSSKMKFAIATILKNAGYVSTIEKKKKKAHTSEHEYLELGLRYLEDGRPAISGVKAISRPSRHMYIKADEIRQVRSGFGIAVISTSQGVMSAQEARKQGLGGEILFEIW